VNRRSFMGMLAAAAMGAVANIYALGASVPTFEKWTEVSFRLTHTFTPDDPAKFFAGWDRRLNEAAQGIADYIDKQIIEGKVPTADGWKEIEWNE
jgi:hypothetical protein